MFCVSTPTIHVAATLPILVGCPLAGAAQTCSGKRPRCCPPLHCCHRDRLQEGIRNEKQPARLVCGHVFPHLHITCLLLSGYVTVLVCKCTEGQIHLCCKYLSCVVLVSLLVNLYVHVKCPYSSFAKHTHARTEEGSQLQHRSEQNINRYTPYSILHVLVIPM